MIAQFRVKGDIDFGASTGALRRGPIVDVTSAVEYNYM